MSNHDGKTLTNQHQPNFTLSEANLETHTLWVTCNLVGDKFNNWAYFVHLFT